VSDITPKQKVRRLWPEAWTEMLGPDRWVIKRHSMTTVYTC
jgi:hypothetical protein